jgi:hypothetical protein
LGPIYNYANRSQYNIWVLKCLGFIESNSLVIVTHRNSFYFIEHHSSHCPFTSSCNTTSLFFTSSPMQTINHPLVTPLILTKHTPPTSAPYQPPTFHVNEGSQPYTGPLQSCTTRTFSPSLSWSLQLTSIIAPNLPPFLQCTFNLHLKYRVPHVVANLLVEG